MSAAETAHAGLMDGVYRRQRHIYDLTRKYYLLGRDDLIEALAPPSGGAVLELGCGTGRNLALAARRWPRAGYFGLDISAEMLATARKNLESFGDKIALAHADASHFDATTLFGADRFDRVFFSYALSMIPPWEKAIDAALEALRPGGELHIVDFGEQEALPAWFRRALRAWLARFHVTPRDALRDMLFAAAERHGAAVSFRSIRRGYAVLAKVTLPAA